MQTVRVYRLHPSAKLFALLKAAQKEAAHVWNLCMETHKQARMTRSKWPGRDALQKSTKGQFASHSQSVQMTVHISCFTGSERGTSSQCPCCGHKHKPKGRNWACRACGFVGHRDLVGAANMHQLAYGAQVRFPRFFTYLRPGFPRRRSRADTPQCCLSESTGQPLLDEQVSMGTGHTVAVAQKPVSL